MNSPGSWFRASSWALLIAGAATSAWAPCARADDSAVVGAVNDSHERALTCMTQAIAYEAGFEPLTGQQAVAEVILNRTRQPQFPTSVCGVVFQGSERVTGCQFTFTCDGSLRRRLSDRVMDQAREVASAALGNQIPMRLGGAINYHADYVSPRWATTMVRVAKIGRHIFYRPMGLPTVVRSYSGPDDGGGPGAFAADLPNAQSASRLAADTVQVFSLWGLASAPTRRP